MNSTTYVTISVLQLLEYVDPEGKSHFRAWFDRLDPVAAARITVALGRIELRIATWC